MRYTGIYAILSPSGRRYVGQAVDLDRREDEHWKYPINTKVARSYKKYGVASHVFEFLEICEESKLDEREYYWQKRYKAVEKGLNMQYVSFQGRSIEQRQEVKSRRVQTYKSTIGTLILRKVTVECKTCKKEFLRYRSQIKENNYCSQECRKGGGWKNPNKIREQVKCSHPACESIFELQPHRIKKDGNYCSKNCGYTAKKVVVCCTTCKKSFFRSKSRVGLNNFCSLQCSQQSRKRK